MQRDSALNRLTTDDVLAKKNSDTIFILGSGYSINSVTQRQWDIIRQHDSIGFNWFCKHSFVPTFFLVREQANLPTRRNKDETPEILIDRINQMNCCTIICKVNHHTKTAYRYYRDPKITAPCWLLKDNNGKLSIKNMRKNPKVVGSLHGTCTLSNVLHFAKFLNYRNIVFVGIDLYDSRYFWLSQSATRHTLKKKNRNHKRKHPITRKTLALVKRFNRAFTNQLYVTNPKSLLIKVIPHKPIEDFA